MAGGPVQNSKKTSNHHERQYRLPAWFDYWVLDDQGSLRLPEARVAFYHLGGEHLPVSARLDESLGGQVSLTTIQV